MNVTRHIEDFEFSYTVRNRAVESPESPREFTSQARHERVSRYSRRAAPAPLRDGVARRSNQRFTR